MESAEPDNDPRFGTPPDRCASVDGYEGFFDAIDWRAFSA
jgi:hypothetical protein